MIICITSADRRLKLSSVEQIRVSIRKEHKTRMIREFLNKTNHSTVQQIIIFFFYINHQLLLCILHFVQSCLITGGSVFEIACSALLKTNWCCSDVSCHHLQDFTAWFHPQDCFAPINRPIHAPSLD